MDYTVEELLSLYRDTIKNVEKYSIDMNSKDYINAKELEQYYKDKIISLIKNGSFV